jgi:hypothetical protein
MFALQGVSLEGAYAAELIAGGNVNVTSRRRTVTVAGKSVQIGADLEDVPKVIIGSKSSNLMTRPNPLAQLPTKEVKIKAIPTGEIEITIGPKMLIAVNSLQIKITYLEHSIELDATGIKLASKGKIALNAPMIELNGSISTKVTGGLGEMTANSSGAVLKSGGNSIGAGVAGVKGESAGPFKIDGAVISHG